MTRATCRACGARYVRVSAGAVCGLCRVQGRTGPPAAPVYHRVRVIAPGSGWRGREGIGRETSTLMRVDFGDGGGWKSFRKNGVEVIENA